MEKCTSVLMLYARSTAFRLLGILTAAGVIETILVSLAFDSAPSLEEIFYNSHISMVCGAAFLLWTFTLSLPQFTKSGYILRRMQLTPRALFLCHLVYNALCYILFWSFHVHLLLVLFYWFGTKADASMFGPQSILLVFYRIDFLHSLLPLADWTRYLRNGCFALLLGAAAAYPLIRRDHISSQLILAAFSLVMLWLFPASIGSSTMDWLLSALSAFCMILLIACATTLDDEPSLAVTDTPVAAVFEDVDEHEN